MDFSHEMIVTNENFSFKLFLFEGRDGNYVREKHWHRSVEIFAVFEGELNFFVNDREYPLHVGEFMLVNSNEIHSVRSPKPNMTIVLQIPLALFTDYFTDEQFIAFSHNTREQDEEFMQNLKDLYQLYLKKDTGYDFEMKALFYHLMYLLVSKYRKTDVNPKVVQKSKGLNRLSQITGYLKENYTKEFSLETLADIFGYSPSYISRMFQKYANTNYKSYLQGIRLEYAFREMANTDHTISGVAMNNGFPNSKAFSKAFKEKYGIMPSEYRKRENHSKGQKNAID